MKTSKKDSNTAVSEFLDYDSSISSVLDELNFFDALEVDKIGAEILGHNWQSIKHLKMF